MQFIRYCPPRFALGIAFLLMVQLAFSAQAFSQTDPPQVTIGERLFLETRFAEFFHRNFNGDVNATLANGDPVLDTTVTTGSALPGPFSGKSMNCRACHLVDEHSESRGNRTYGDFAARSPIPLREDGKTVTPRNSPPLVNSAIAKRGLFLHFDGQFQTLSDLVETTLTGRNYGWLQNEHSVAVAHIAQVLREDNGQNDFALDTGSLSYAVLLKGASASIPIGLRLSKAFRLDVAAASDAELLRGISKLISAYVQSLQFATDSYGSYIGSPFDLFLKLNNLPRKPSPKESDAAYSQRLEYLLRNLRQIRYVKPADSHFEFHQQNFVFGPEELKGLKVFLGRGNCGSCHPAPNFTDFKFHNTGAAQEEYDAVYGANAFSALHIPGLIERNGAPHLFLPPSRAFPHALGPMLEIPNAAVPGLTDLGLWNVFLNRNVPHPQAQVKKLLCPSGICSNAQLLQRSIAQFKTPGLRDLADSAPYLHTGRKDSIEDVIRFYIEFADKSRNGEVRNADPLIKGVKINEGDVRSLKRFLDSLTEDYS